MDGVTVASGNYLYRTITGKKVMRIYGRNTMSNQPS